VAVRLDLVSLRRQRVVMVLAIRTAMVGRGLGIARKMERQEAGLTGQEKMAGVLRDWSHMSV
jgi:hypothetical protein